MSLASSADPLLAVADLLETFAGLVWSTPVAGLLAGAGLLFTLVTRFVQWRALTHGFAIITGKYDDPADEGNISHFQALSAALSATIGLGNIAGVAVAIAVGGPGAVFWMWMVGLLGMATKFVTCSLAVMYRRQDERGEYRGGPMYYIQMGLGATPGGLRVFATILAFAFALFGAVASFGIGNMFQANQVAEISETFVRQSGLAGDVDRTGLRLGVGFVLALLTGLVIIGGIRRIGQVAGKLVPGMCLIYVVGALWVILSNVGLVPQVFGQIFAAAFTSTAAGGAFLGAGVWLAIEQGLRRGVFSNEAGLGSAPMAHATARTNEPIREGVVAATGPFIDTLVVCTMTALVILITGVLDRPAVGTVVGGPTIVTDSSGTRIVLKIDPADAKAPPINDELLFKTVEPPVDDGAAAGEQPDAPAVIGTVIVTTADAVDADTGHLVARMAAPDDPGAQAALVAKIERGIAREPAVYLHRGGVKLTAYAFDQSIAGFGSFFVPIAAFLFAFSTMISWSYYGETCATFLLGDRAVLPFKSLFVVAIVVGAATPQLDPIINLSDGLMGLMLVPNLLGALLLLPVVLRGAHEYFGRLNSGAMAADAARKRAARNAKPFDRES